jgi:uncharacterized protein
MTTNLKGNLTPDMAFAIYGSVSEFGPGNGPAQLTSKTVKPKYEGKAVYELFKGSSIRIYPVSPDVNKVAGDRTYRSLSDLPEKVDAVITCLSKSQALSVVEEASRAGVKHIFFQPGTDSPAAVALCKAKGIQYAKGCMMTHWSVTGLKRFVSPCFYMGLGAAKLPAR